MTQRTCTTTSPKTDGANATSRNAPHKSGRVRSIETQLRKFDVSVRREARRLVRSHARIAELALSFPGLLHHLAMLTRDERAPNGRAQRLLEQVIDGRPMKDIAALAGCPMWMRRLPPEAFCRLHGRLPTSDRFQRAIQARLPVKRASSARWLEAVSFANEAAGEAFALWTAERAEMLPPDLPAERTLRVLAAYTLASRRLERGAGKLVRTPWHPVIGNTGMICGAMSWLKRIDLMVTRSGLAAEPWLLPDIQHGFSFEPLSSAEDLVSEALTMRNCLDHYAQQLNAGACQLFAVRRGGTSIATLEIMPHAKECHAYSISQIKGRANAAVSDDVWKAAYAWLASQPSLMVRERIPAPPRYDTKVWDELFQPLGLVGRTDAGALWWPQRISAREMSLLLHDLAQLAKSAMVRSWQFR
ncbi:MAG: PcfJ domain-containing protein [Hyphomicrobiaceae bacterium]